MSFFLIFLISFFTFVLGELELPGVHPALVFIALIFATFGNYYGYRRAMHLSVCNHNKKTIPRDQKLKVTAFLVLEAIIFFGNVPPFFFPLSGYLLIIGCLLTGVFAFAFKFTKKPECYQQIMESVRKNRQKYRD